MNDADSMSISEAEVLSWLNEDERERAQLAHSPYLDLLEKPWADDVKELLRRLAETRKALWTAKEGVDAGIGDGCDCPLCGIGFEVTRMGDDPDAGQIHKPSCVFSTMPRPIRTSA